MEPSRCLTSVAVIFKAISDTLESVAISAVCNCTCMSHASFLFQWLNRRSNAEASCGSDSRKPSLRCFLVPGLSITSYPAPPWKTQTGSWMMSFSMSSFERARGNVRRYSQAAKLLNLRLPTALPYQRTRRLDTSSQVPNRPCVLCDLWHVRMLLVWEPGDLQLESWHSGLHREGE